jgi:hypothetical protein
MTRLRPLPYPVKCGTALDMQRPSSLVPDAEERIRGLGDAVAVGIKAATFGLVRPCGACEERRRRLNELMPFGSASR